MTIKVTNLLKANTAVRQYDFQNKKNNQIHPTLKIKFESNRMNDLQTDKKKHELEIFFFSTATCALFV